MKRSRGSICVHGKVSSAIIPLVNTCSPDVVQLAPMGDRSARYHSCGTALQNVRENKKDWAQGWKVSSSAVSGMHNGAGQASDWHMASPGHTDAYREGGRSGCQGTQDDGDAAIVMAA